MDPLSRRSDDCSTWDDCEQYNSDRDGIPRWSFLLTLAYAPLIPLFRTSATFDWSSERRSAVDDSGNVYFRVGSESIIRSVTRLNLYHGVVDDPRPVAQETIIVRFFKSHGLGVSLGPCHSTL